MASHLIKVYDIYENDKFLDTGTLQELSECFKCSPQKLYDIYRRNAERKDGLRVLYSHSVDKEHYNEYTLYFGDEVVAHGNYEDIIKKTGISRSELRHAKFNGSGKRERQKCYFLVGGEEE